MRAQPGRPCGLRTCPSLPTSVTGECTTASPVQVGVSPREDLCPEFSQDLNRGLGLVTLVLEKPSPWGGGTEPFLELSLQASSSELYEEDWFVTLGVWSLWCEITVSSQKPGGVAWPSLGLTGQVPSLCPLAPPRRRLSMRRAATASWLREPVCRCRYSFLPSYEKFRSYFPKVSTFFGSYF